jgi:hypothetical protein
VNKLQDNTSGFKGGVFVAGSLKAEKPSLFKSATKTHVLDERCQSVKESWKMDENSPERTLKQLEVNYLKK